MISIQKEFNAARGDVVRLLPDEYEGPLVIDHRCVVDGGGATILCAEGPVITVTAKGVTLKNLRIEVTSEEKNPSSEIAIRSSAPDTRLENVEVRGRVVGFAGEPDAWELPTLINLGNFAADSSNTFLYTIQSPGNARLKVNVNGMSVTPSSLRPGKNTVLLTTEELRNNSRLYGEIMVVSAVSRRIYVTGCAVKNAPRHTDVLPAETRPAAKPVNPPPASPAPDPSVRMLQRGQRIPVSEFGGDKLRFEMDYAGIPEGMEVDCYCFALNENGKVSGDQDLIFFGNEQSVDLSVVAGYYGRKPVASIDLSRVGQSVNKIAVCFAIYGDDPRHTFSKITSPVVRMSGKDKECFILDLSDLKMERACVAVEIYRHKGQWKINPVGAGYRDSLRQLCMSFGVDVK